MAKIKARVNQFAQRSKKNMFWFIIIAISLISIALSKYWPKYSAEATVLEQTVPGSGDKYYNEQKLDYNKVSHNGTYSTAVQIAVPDSAFSPSIQLNYDSASQSSIAGIGWDLSIGYPSMISRDVLKGTPDWSNSEWLFGAMDLVKDSTTVKGSTTFDTYKLKIDDLSSVLIPRNNNNENALVYLSTGITLTYMPLVYDGVKYPKAPESAIGYNVFGYLLIKATSVHGYNIEYEYEHDTEQSTSGEYINKDFGKLPVIARIKYGNTQKTQGQSHLIEFSYEDFMDCYKLNKKICYTVTHSMKYGAPTMLSEILKTISVKSYNDNLQYQYDLLYQTPDASETRKPRLHKVLQTSFTLDKLNPQSRLIRQFEYGNRHIGYDQSPKLITLGDVNNYPESLSGNVTRKMLPATNTVVGPIKVPWGTSVGRDQVEPNAEPTHSTTESWNISDINADGLVDIVWAKEKGFDNNSPWTYEKTDPSNGPPAQQRLLLNNGIVNGKLSTKILEIDLNKDSKRSNRQSQISAYGAYPNPANNDSKKPRWIWPEGRGMYRTGMPVSVTIPDLDKYRTLCDPYSFLFNELFDLKEYRDWPILPDGVIAGSDSSLSDSARNWQELPNVMLPQENNMLSTIIGGIATYVNLFSDIEIPQDVINAEVSGWNNIDNKNTPDFISTNGFIHYYDNPLCDPSQQPKNRNVNVHFANDKDSKWYRSSIDFDNTNAVTMSDVTFSQRLKWGLPLSYSVSSGSGFGFGLSIPITSLGKAAINVALSNEKNRASTIVSNFVGVVAKSVNSASSSSSQPGTLSLNTVSPSMYSVVSNYANSGPITGTLTTLAGTVPELDLTIFQKGSYSRSYGLGEFIDINGDGYKDYVIIDKSGNIDLGQGRDGMKVFLNLKNGNLAENPITINNAFKIDKYTNLVNATTQSTKSVDTTISSMWYGQVPQLGSSAILDGMTEGDKNKLDQNSANDNATVSDSEIIKESDVTYLVVYELEVDNKGNVIKDDSGRPIRKKDRSRKPIIKSKTAINLESNQTKELARKGVSVSPCAIKTLRDSNAIIAATCGTLLFTIYLKVKYEYDQVNKSYGLKQYLLTSPDVLRQERELYNQLDALEGILYAHQAYVSAITLASIVPQIAACTTTGGCGPCVVGPASGCGLYTDYYEFIIERLMKISRNLDRTVKRFEPLNRLSSLSSSKSMYEGKAPGKLGRGVSYKKSGLIDINGDSLPDFVTTNPKDKICSSNQWEVYWGTGTSNINVSSRSSGFTLNPQCINVPSIPSSLADELKLYFDIKEITDWDKHKGDQLTTLPLSVDLTSSDGVITKIQQPDGNKIDVVTEDTTVSRSYVSISDYNQDGKPDIIIAGNSMDRKLTTNNWYIYLNQGFNFSLTPLVVASPVISDNLKNGQIKIKPSSIYNELVKEQNGNAVPNVPYPGFSSSKTIRTFFNSSQARSRSDLNAGMIDVDGDGNTDVVLMVDHTTPAGSNNYSERGMLVWSRAGSGPNDLLMEEYYPVYGQSINVHYKSNGQFQWKDGDYTGADPQLGHFSLDGVPQYLVSTVKINNLIGIQDQATMYGYDYKKPYMDHKNMAFYGFGYRSIKSLDPITEIAILNSSVIEIINPQSVQLGPSQSIYRESNANNGAPSVEHLTGYNYIKRGLGSASNKKEINHYSVNSLYKIEYPDSLTKGASFAVTFDGKTPFLDNVTSLNYQTLQNYTRLPQLNSTAASGGAAKFDGETGLRYALNLDFKAGVTFEAFIKYNTVLRGVEQPAYVIATNNVNGKTLTLAYDTKNADISTVPIIAQYANQTVSAIVERDRWTHFAVSIDNSTLILFINGTSYQGQLTTGADTHSNLFVGTAAGTSTPSANKVEYEITDLRIYNQSWKDPVRVSGSEYQYDYNNSGKVTYAQLLEERQYNDLIDDSDDLYLRYRYAEPVYNSTVKIYGLVSSVVKEVKESDTWTYSLAETYYDNKGLHLYDNVANVTSVLNYDGKPFINKSTISGPKSRFEYNDTHCPNRITKTIDPLNNKSHQSWDKSCTYVINSENALGHKEYNYYYGVNNIDYSFPRETNYVGQSSKLVFAGGYGNLAEVANDNTLSYEYRHDPIIPQVTQRKGQGSIYGPSTTFATRIRYSYDPWGKVIITRKPLDRLDIPSERREYSDAICTSPIDKNLLLPCVGTAVISRPSLLIVSNWNDNTLSYDKTYSYSDGQVHMFETIEGIDNIETIYGIIDRDNQGRVIRKYKKFRLDNYTQSLPQNSNRLPGDWLNNQIENDIKKVLSSVQIVYDYKGRTVKVYGYNYKKCDLDDPQYNCPLQNNNVLSDVTRYLYTLPGVVKVKDAKSHIEETRHDSRGLLVKTARYSNNNLDTPYSFLEYIYDNLGRQIVIKDQTGNDVVSQYDGLDRKVATTTHNAGKHEIEYNLNSQITNIYNNNGDMTENDYDEVRRIKTTKYNVLESENKVGKCSSSTNTTNPDLQINQWPPDLYYDPCQLFGQYSIKKTDFNEYNSLRWSRLNISNGNNDDGVALLTLPFDVVLAPNYARQNGSKVISDYKTLLYKKGTTAYISTNGKVRFDRGGENDLLYKIINLNDNITETSLYPYYADLNNISTQHGIDYAIVGDGSSQKLFIRWTSVDKQSANSNIQVILSINQKNYEVQYFYGNVGSETKPIIGSAHIPESGKGFFVGVKNDSSGSYKPSPGMTVTSRMCDFLKAPGLLHQTRIPLFRTTAQTRQSNSTRINLKVSSRTSAFSRIHLKTNLYSICSNSHDYGSCIKNKVRIAYQVKNRTNETVSLVEPDHLLLNTNRQSSLYANQQSFTIDIPAELRGKSFDLIYFVEKANFPTPRVNNLADSNSYQFATDYNYLDIVVVDVDDCTKSERKYINEETVYHNYDNGQSDYYEGLHNNKFSEVQDLMYIDFNTPNYYNSGLTGKSYSIQHTSNLLVEPTLGINGYGVKLNCTTRLAVLPLLNRTSCGSLTAKFTGNNNNNKINNGFTYSLWLKPEAIQVTSQNGERVIASINQGMIDLMINASNQIKLISQGQSVTSTKAVSEDAWSQIALSYRSNRLELYLNGQLQQTMNITLSQTHFKSIIIGGNNPLRFSSSSLALYIDEVRLYAHTLDQRQIYNNYASILNRGSLKGNVLSLSFNDSSLPFNNEKPFDNIKYNVVGLSGNTISDQIIPGIQGMSLDLTNKSTTQSVRQIKVDGVYETQKQALPINKSFNILNGVTVEAWIKIQNGYVSKANISELIVGKTGNNNGWRFGIEPQSGRLRWDILEKQSSGASSSSQIKDYTFVTLEEINDGKWHHVAGTYNKQSMMVYIDGIPAHSSCSPYSIVLKGQNEPTLSIDGTKCVNNNGLPSPAPQEEVKCANYDQLNLDGPTPYSSIICLINKPFDNDDPVLIGKDAVGEINAQLDELNVSNYAKRPYEIAASSRLASAYMQNLGNHTEIKNYITPKARIPAITAMTSLVKPLTNRVSREIKSYDLMGRIIYAEKSINKFDETGELNNYIMRYNVNSDGAVGTEMKPSGEVVYNQFDGNGAVTKIDLFGIFNYVQSNKLKGNLNIQSNLVSTLNGMVSEIRFGNMTSEKYTYYDKILSNRNGSGAELLHERKVSTVKSACVLPCVSKLNMTNYRYEWDEVGNLMKVDNTTDVIIKQYSYDDFYRMTSATYNINGNSTVMTYGYDAQDNIVSKEGVGQFYGRANSSTEYKNICKDYGLTLPHALVQKGLTINNDLSYFCYDAKGRLTEQYSSSVLVKKNEYYSSGRLRSTKLQSGDILVYYYDGWGNRIFNREEKVGGIKISTYEPYHTYKQEYNASNVKTYQYQSNERGTVNYSVFSSDVLGDSTYNNYWIHSDTTQNLELVTDNEGKIVANIEYKPYGEFFTKNVIVYDSGGRYYNGKNLDTTGYYNYGARYYDPSIGRFLQPDVYLTNDQNDGYNVYSYAYNNPVKYIDYNGNSPAVKERRTRPVVFYVRYSDNQVPTSTVHFEVSYWAGNEEIWQKGKTISGSFSVDLPNKATKVTVILDRQQPTAFSTSGRGTVKKRVSGTDWVLAVKPMIVSEKIVSQQNQQSKATTSGTNQSTMSQSMSQALGLEAYIQGELSTNADAHYKIPGVGKAEVETKMAAKAGASASYKFNNATSNVLSDHLNQATEFTTGDQRTKETERTYEVPVPNGGLRCVNGCTKE